MNLSFCLLGLSDANPKAGDEAVDPDSELQLDGDLGALRFGFSGADEVEDDPSFEFFCPIEVVRSLLTRKLGELEGYSLFR